MRKLMLSLAFCLALVSRHGQAGAANQFNIDWYSYDHPGSCLAPGLAVEGQANFWVNSVPIPTYSDWESLREWADGSFEMMFHAPFSGTLFRIGVNQISMGDSTVGDGDYCTHNDNVVRLRGPSVDRLLFEYSRNGSAFEGETDVALALREIDPLLADSLADLKEAIEEARDELRRTAHDADELADGLERLAELEAALDALLEQGFDGISLEELNALLAAYDDLMPGVRDALVEFLADLQADVEELREEIDRISEVFRSQIDDVDDVVGGAPGWDPEDDGGFEPIEDGEFPPIDVPDVLGDDPWSPEHDPYANYADEVLAALATTVSGGHVVDRPGFVAIYGAWRYNMDVLELILQMRSVVSVGEWGAYLTARNRVLSYAQQFIDSRGWLEGAPIPPAVRAFVELMKDLDDVYRFKLRAEALQMELNTWSGDLTDRQRTILDILLLLDALARERLAQPAPEADDDGFWDTLGGIVDTAISFTPVGDFLDACAMITGKEGCWDGRDLTLKERAMYGLGVVVGSGAAWKAAASTVSAGAVGAVRKVGDVLDDLVPRRPDFGNNPDIVQRIPHSGGAVTYVHANGLSVKYNRRGFPDFRPHLADPVPGKRHDVHIELTGRRDLDKQAANLEAGYPENQVHACCRWHHHEELGRMQLVKKEAHDKFAHTGGFVIWERVNERPYE